MFKLIVMFKRKAGMSMDQFIDHYENVHAVLARKILPPQDLYRRNYIMADDPFIDHIGDNRSVREEPPFDVVTEAIYSTREDAIACVETFFRGESGREIVEDEANFVEPGSVKFYVVKVYQSSIPW